MSDRSLDEFANANANGDDEDDAEPTARPPEPSPTPATPTMRWSTDPVACDDCGAAVARRWRDGDSYVCADCKEW
ncbi:DUF7573 domain-containing protein [Haloplanus aerogenes]|uniref:DUF7573 domain-containing protein n=1 Tax=Haloplanus aerogenes TaxID=660522 RepID=A0A3G8QPT9_9EURY|nr:hypothetical protein [Haloplanus aerogenes]AZH24165.1 hypothetical protein DU502_01695 [Haloplanus aerogenes]